MSRELDILIEFEREVSAIKYYALATCTILFYDYLVTLADEVEYVWSGKKSWTFWLFIANRYFPMTHQIWVLITWLRAPSVKFCEKALWYLPFSSTVCTLLVQVILTLRVYAVTMKNIWITVCFGVMTVSQLAVGASTTILTAKQGVQPITGLPFESYRFCVPSPHRPLEIAYTVGWLVYEILTFSLIIYLAKTSEKPGLNFPRIMETIAKDATWYFLVIFTSHLVLLFTLVFARYGIQVLPAFGNAVYPPVMVSRIILSLRMAADPQRGVRSHGGPTANGANLTELKFVRPRGSANERESDILLDEYSRP